MEFDKSRVYTAVNADELKVGSKVICADTVKVLRKKVQADDYAQYVQPFIRLYDNGYDVQFLADCYTYNYAYLIEPPSKPKYRPFESVDKAMEAIKAHGRYVIKTNNMMSAFRVTEDDEDQEESRIFIDSHWYSLQELCRLFVFADDGSPCGELVEE